MSRYLVRVCRGKKSKNFTIHSPLPLEAIYNSLKSHGKRGFALYENGVPTQIELSVILSYQNGSWVPHLKRMGYNGGESP